MGLRRGQKYIHFSDAEIAAMKKMHSDGASGRTIARQYGICAETALKIVSDTWTPREVKLGVTNETLYLDYLLLGSFGAVARKYSVTDKAVKKRLRVYMDSIGVEPQYEPSPRKLPESDRQVFFDYLELGTYAAVGRKYYAAPKTARVRILKIVESGASEEFRKAWLEADPFGC